MIDDLHAEIETLNKKIKLMERATVVCLVGMCVSLRFGHEEWMALIGLICICQICRLVFKHQLKQKETLLQAVEERTQEIRSEKDAIQEQSDKLAAALKALAEAQDELVRKERMATIGELTQGLVDRILNPLNYINNFASLTSGLVNDMQEDLETQKDRLDAEVYEDVEDVMNLMKVNLAKIAEHGSNTVRIMKAMEELLKDRRSHFVQTDVNGMCRVILDQMSKAYGEELKEKHVRVTFEPLSLSLMVEMNADQIGKSIAELVKNAVYSVLKKAETNDYTPEIYVGLRHIGDNLQVTVRDNGTGIDARIKEKVFAPFFTTKPTSEASGIGLYLCRESVQNHRGTIELKTEKGVFTEFIITIPVYQTKKDEATEQEEQ